MTARITARRVVRDSPLADQVTIIHWPQRPGQLSAYRHFIDIFAPGFDWAAFIDLDEFLLPLDAGSVPDVLERSGTASVVLAHWRVFGPGDWTEQPAGSGRSRITTAARPTIST